MRASMNVVRGSLALCSVPLFLVWEVHAANIRNILLDCVLSHSAQIGIPPQESRREVLGNSKHVVEY